MPYNSYYIEYLKKFKMTTMKNMYKYIDIPELVKGNSVSIT